MKIHVLLGVPSKINFRMKQKKEMLHYFMNTNKN